jgi:hypothetical protein
MAAFGVASLKTFKFYFKLEQLSRSLQSETDGGFEPPVYILASNPISRIAFIVVFWARIFDYVIYFHHSGVSGGSIAKSLAVLY